MQAECHYSKKKFKENKLDNTPSFAWTGLECLKWAYLIFLSH